MRSLRVVVADDHHHVLPEIHLALRRRLLPFSGVHIVHWDAHPDLSFSSALDAAYVFEPEQLYDALDASSSGIAEFLLPLVYAGHVDRITWIKPSWAHQMHAGDTMERIAIGRRKDTDSLAVTCPWTHFIDDNLYVEESALDPTTIKRWTLSVMEDPQDVPIATPWVLDVDLDYFSTWNPFRHNLAQLCSPTDLAILTRVFTRPRYKLSSSLLTPQARTIERQAYLQTMDRIQHLELSELELLLPELIDTLVPLYEENDMDVTLRAFLRLPLLFDDATRATIWTGAPCLDLPHHESNEHELDDLLQGFRTFVESAKASNPPALVTIATSVSDRFLPPHQLVVVKNRVLGILDEVFGPVQIDEIEYEDIENGSNE